MGGCFFLPHPAFSKGEGVLKSVYFSIIKPLSFGERLG
jgi:hypothetical protein